MTNAEKDVVTEAVEDIDSGIGSAPSSDTDATQAKAAADDQASAAAEPHEGEEVVEADVTDEAPEAEQEDEIAAAKAQVQEWQDKYLRLHAEWDTYRRRTNEQREAERARATEKLVESLLPVIDDFERTIDYAEKNGEGDLLAGVQAVHTKFIDVLVKGGVAIIDPKGGPFDALEAQAVAMVDDATVPDETVADVYQKGYKMGTKVIRPAMVTVATGGPKRPKPEAAEEE